MKCRLTKLVVFLLLGAIVNVAVAWGIAIWVDGSEGEEAFGSTTADGVVWSVTVIRLPGALSIDSLRWRLPANPKGITYEGPSVSDVAPYWGGLATPTAAFLNKTGGDWRQLEGRGWPAISLWYMGDHSDVPDLVSRTQPVHGAFPAELYLIPEERPWFHPPRPLPLRPASRGFAINTIFYAAIVWLLALVPFTARRVIRHRRGLCIRCGYDLRGTSGGSSEGGSVCPECGWERASA